MFQSRLHDCSVQRKLRCIATGVRGRCSHHVSNFHPRRVRKINLRLSKAFLTLRIWFIFAIDAAARHGPCTTNRHDLFACGTHLLNAPRRHRGLTTYVDYYNRARPHQGIDQRCPIPLESTARAGPIERRDILGGVLHEYRRDVSELSSRRICRFDLPHS